MSEHFHVVIAERDGKARRVAVRTFEAAQREGVLELAADRLRQAVVETCTGSCLGPEPELRRRQPA